MGKVTDGAKGVKHSKEYYAELLHKAFIKKLIEQTTPKNKINKLPIKEIEKIYKQIENIEKNYPYSEEYINF